MKADNQTQKTVLATLEKFADAYGSRDVESLMATVAPDEDVVLYGTGADEKRVGPAAIEAQAKRDWEQSDSATLVFESVSVSAAGTVAWAAVDGAFAIRSQGRSMKLPARITFVLEHRDGQWLIVQMHFSMPAASQAEGSSF